MWPFSSPYPTRQPLELRAEYDYIIVGGGTGGCVLARRLAEDSNCSVLVVERGDARDNWLDRFPLASTHHWSDRKHSMVLTADMLGAKTDIITGKGLGGTSRINAMQYSRGTPGEYNAWAQAGREGWSYQELLPYFERAEGLYSPATKGHYGTEGPWKIQAPTTTFKFGVNKHLFQAAQRVGFSYGKDVSDPKLPTSGCFLIHHTIEPSGTRHSTFRAYLPKDFVEAHDENLHLSVNTIARKIETEPLPDGSLQASGVLIQNSAPGSASVLVKARREVILCSGALRTPQVLMLSGIGPEKHLRDMGIPVVHNLEGVGSNFQDHMGTHMDLQCPLHDSLALLIKRPWYLLYQLFRYFIFGDGWFLTSLVEVCILTCSRWLNEDGSQKPLSEEDKDSSKPENVPDIEIMSSPIVDWRFPGYDHSRGGFTMLAAPQRPFSRGTVRLASSDPLAQPAVTLNYLAFPRDRAVLRAAVRLCMRVVREMEAGGYAVGHWRAPRGTDDAALDAFIQAQSWSFLHYSSSCRMAPRDDPEPGVVDHALRVHGIPNLRIADASVFPQIPAAHLQAPVVVVAEKCADMIKAAWAV
ncbi:GMC oxidoreductase [Phanerochaete sordida]|uniref:GMC oxidoreductase n=1 Tax=Phanerochaete sordida TaxID=48140 RepID=A0A9P3GAY1_9APHY|nr:GMC oxidoreductase [Phanerochaete sordida]